MRPDAAGRGPRASVGRRPGGSSGWTMPRIREPSVEQMSPAHVRSAMYDRILVPTDGSEAVDGAIDRAIDLATQYGATLHAVAVVEPIYTVNEGLGSIYDTLESDARASVDEVAERGEAADVTVVTALRTGVTHREILDYAEEEDVDLIVMGTHGRTGLDRYLLGSVTEKVVRLSDVPVLTVRQREDGAAGGDE